MFFVDIWDIFCELHHPQAYEEKEKDLNGNKESKMESRVTANFNGGADLNSLFRAPQEGGYAFPIKREEEETEVEGRRNGEFLQTDYIFPI